ncbi:hypothetical protein LTR85_002770 [Meristemomyces frigidus]|nr:hypothetical protein LTR85_002770 [Meristemomyces frigidus]
MTETRAPSTRPEYVPNQYAAYAPQQPANPGYAPQQPAYAEYAPPAAQQPAQPPPQQPAIGYDETQAVLTARLQQSAQSNWTPPGAEARAAAQPQAAPAWPAGGLHDPLGLVDRQGNIRYNPLPRGWTNAHVRNHVFNMLDPRLTDANHQPDTFE